MRFSVTALMKPLSFALAFGIVCGLVSCEDDPELISKRDQQRAEIQSLETELVLLREKIKNAPEDRSEELAELKAVVAKDEEDIAELETSIADLKQQADELEKELDDYKSNYPLR